jgi:hypothetical protein
MTTEAHSPDSPLIEINLTLSPRLPALLSRLFGRFVRLTIEPPTAFGRDLTESPDKASARPTIAAQPIAAADKPRSPRSGVRELVDRPGPERVYWSRRKPQLICDFAPSVLECLDRIGIPLTRAEIGRQTGWYPKQINAAVLELRQRGLIEQLATLPWTTFKIVDPTSTAKASPA